MSADAGTPAQLAQHAQHARIARREYGFALLAGAVGAGLILLAVRQEWAKAVFTQPRPLPAETIDVSGSDLVPVAGALALVALAALAAVIATRGRVRRAVGVLLALFGAGAGAAIMSAVTAASVLSVAASKVGSAESAALSGSAGSTTSGSSSTGSFVVSGSTGQAIMTGAPWHVAVLAGALLIFAAGLLTALRGPDWPVMSTRYDAPPARGARDRAAAGRPHDSATMWESLSGGDDPTDYEDALMDDDPHGATGASVTGASATEATATGASATGASATGASATGGTSATEDASAR